MKTLLAILSFLFCSLAIAQPVVNIRIPAGSVGTPGAFIGTSATTGFYQSAANQIGFTVSGVQVGFFSSTGLNNTVIGGTTPAAGTFTTLIGTAGTLSGIGKDTMSSDTAARATTFAGANAWAQATVNTTGGALGISPGIGRRFVTVVDYSLIDLPTDTITITVVTASGSTANVGTATAATQDATNFIVATSNAVTATNICTWADQLAGVSATASGSSCYITPDAATYSVTLATTMTAGEGTVTSGTDGALTIVGGSGTNVLDNIVIGSRTAAAGTFTTATAADAGSFRFTTDTLITRYAAKQVMISGDGTGATTNAGWIFGYYGSGTQSGLWTTIAVPTTNNYVLSGDTNDVFLNTPTSSGSLYFRIANATTKMVVSNTAGAGPSITAGTATTDVNALNITQTLNAGGVTFGGSIKSTTTWTAAAAGSKLVDIIQDSSSAFSILGVASGLNGVSLQMGATTVGPTISAQGETNVPFTVTSKGSGKILLASNTGILHTTGAGTQLGGATALTLTDSAVGLSKMTASASAPGASGAKLELVCGTNAGTAKLTIAAGTSATVVTVVDNIGAGVTGC